ncbi:SDR family oxidoreductase [Umezawaea tangerina]|uniref:NADP-dependent 3-hydroxy acid dehydrogenase YdfG n=1 Tax=Umezawaea tangerina TaxID=84725 RepID=A0A2T0T527_9PSEU|nr:SDR family oxidoreductase [Umezawaea tangerina]PRY40776.1 NADP-dependent 3-hydroxy acid dehydrogenase YdfG [Umezawaea tangerina]
MSGIDGKVVAITGASSGIGRATATLLAERGAKLVLGARGADRLEEAATHLTALGAEVAFLPTDVRNRPDVTALVDLAKERFGRLDVFIGNAGVMPISPMDDLKVDDWEAMVDVNVKGVLYGIAAALPVFREQRSGHFVTIASTAGHRIVPTMAVYAGTKFAVRAICEGLRQESGEDLRVTIISPGMTNTEGARTTAGPEVQAQIAATTSASMPPTAVAAAIAYAIDQPANVDVGEIVIRPTAQA